MQVRSSTWWGDGVKGEKLRRTFKLAGEESKPDYGSFNRSLAMILVYIIFSRMSRKASSPFVLVPPYSYPTTLEPSSILQERQRKSATIMGLTLPNP